jgi:hypothetical protein
MMETSLAKVNTPLGIAKDAKGVMTAAHQDEAARGKGDGQN